MKTAVVLILWFAFTPFHYPGAQKQTAVMLEFDTMHNCENALAAWLMQRADMIAPSVAECREIKRADWSVR